MDSPVADFIRKEIPDWDDDVIATTRFKAFSGQRSDWEARFKFWRDLIIKVARHLEQIIIDIEEVKSRWFIRGGLTPLCLDHVLERAAQITSFLAQSHWSSHCVTTIGRFQSLCGGFEAAGVVMSYLTDCKRARHLLIDREDRIEGMKISLVPVPLNDVSQLDYDMLHLYWTLERFQQQLDVLDRRCQKSKRLALTAIKAGDKQAALRHVRGLKISMESKEKCTGLMDRVEEVLGVIADAESTKKVNEAIELGARAIKEHRISVEEVHACLQDLDESIASQKQIEDSLEDDLEEEFKRLEMELEDETHLVQMPAQEEIPASEEEVKQSESEETAESLGQNLSKLKLESA